MPVTTIDLYTAIREMRALTAKGQPFSIAHYTYNRETKQTSGLRVVNSALLRPASSKDQVDNSDHKLFYIDRMEDVPRNCWQVLIVYFNGMKVKVS